MQKRGQNANQRKTLKPGAHVHRSRDSSLHMHTRAAVSTAATHPPCVRKSQWRGSNTCCCVDDAGSTHDKTIIGGLYLACTTVSSRVLASDDDMCSSSGASTALQHTNYHFPVHQGRAGQPQDWVVWW